MERFLTPEQLGGIVRNLVAPLIAYLIARGLIPTDGADALVAGVVSLVTLIWGWLANKSPDRLMTQDQWLGMIRNLAAPWIAYSVGKGWLAAENVEWIVAGVSSVTFTAWSLWSKQPAKVA